MLNIRYIYFKLEKRHSKTKTTVELDDKECRSRAVILSKDMRMKQVPKGIWKQYAFISKKKYVKCLTETWLTEICLL